MLYSFLSFFRRKLKTQVKSADAIMDDKRLITLYNSLIILFEHFVVGYIEGHIFSEKVRTDMKKPPHNIEFIDTDVEGHLPSEAKTQLVAKVFFYTIDKFIILLTEKRKIRGAELKMFLEKIWHYYLNCTGCPCEQFREQLKMRNMVSKENLQLDLTDGLADILGKNTAGSKLKLMLAFDFTFPDILWIINILPPILVKHYLQFSPEEVLAEHPNDKRTELMIEECDMTYKKCCKDYNSKL